MGMTMRLENERGECLVSVGDPTDILGRILPAPEDKRFVCLNRVDRHGDTSFNRLQVHDLIRELRFLHATTGDEPSQTLLRAVTDLALRCAKDHAPLHVRFAGD